MTPHFSSGAETIAAIATPLGVGSIGIIRISGPLSRPILEKVFTPQILQTSCKPYMLRYGTIVDSQSDSALDEVMAVFMPGPKSFTGEDMVEIHCHAGQIPLKHILELIFTHGARPAEAGEFSQRRFLNRGVDLTRLEGAAEVIASKTDLAYRVTREHLMGRYGQHIASLRQRIVHLLAEIEADIDFPDEDSVGTIGKAKLKDNLDEILGELQSLSASYRTGKFIQDGLRVLILGPPNAGKSSLFNALVRQNRALVTEIAGTTRDYLSEWIEIAGLPVELFDTAGLRKGRGRIEQAGINEARKLITRADLILYIFDISTKPKLLKDLILEDHQHLIILLNKADLAESVEKRKVSWLKKLENHSGPVHALSVKTGAGLDKLYDLISKTAGAVDLSESVVVTSLRHKNKIDSTLNHLIRLQSRLDEPPEILSFELRQAADRMGEITGQVYTEQILEEIFANFCIGK